MHRRDFIKIFGSAVLLSPFISLAASSEASELADKLSRTGVPMNEPLSLDYVISAKKDTSLFTATVKAGISMKYKPYLRNPKKVVAEFRISDVFSDQLLTDKMLLLKKALDPSSLGLDNLIREKMVCHEGFYFTENYSVIDFEKNTLSAEFERDHDRIKVIAKDGKTYYHPMRAHDNGPLANMLNYLMQGYESTYALLTLHSLNESPYHKVRSMDVRLPKSDDARQSVEKRIEFLRQPMMNYIWGRVAFSEEVRRVGDRHVRVPYQIRIERILNQDLLKKPYLKRQFERLANYTFIDEQGRQENYLRQRLPHSNKKRIDQFSMARDVVLTLEGFN